MCATSARRPMRDDGRLWRHRSIRQLGASAGVRTPASQTGDPTPTPVHSHLGGRHLLGLSCPGTTANDAWPDVGTLHQSAAPPKPDSVAQSGDRRNGRQVARVAPVPAQRFDLVARVGVINRKGESTPGAQPQPWESHTDCTDEANDNRQPALA